MTDNKGRIVVGITGASGSIYGLKLVETLLSRSFEVHLIITESGELVISEETGLDIKDKSLAERKKELEKYFSDSNNLEYYSNEEIDSALASGSYSVEGMIVLPCTMGTLSGISTGRSQNLLERAADVTIKEERNLIICPREMPFNSIHLENMLKLSRLGVTIAPPIPGFYIEPESMEDLIYHVVGKLLDIMGIENDVYNRWTGIK